MPSNKAGLIKIFLSLAIGASLSFANESACEIESVKTALNELNAGLPYKLDKHTVATSVACENGDLVYNYKIEDGEEMKFSKMPESSIDFLKQALPTSMLNDEICENIKELAAHLKNAKYNFYLENGRLLSTSTESLSVCKK